MIISHSTNVVLAFLPSLLKTTVLICVLAGRRSLSSTPSRWILHCNSGRLKLSELRSRRRNSTLVHSVVWLGRATGSLASDLSVCVYVFIMLGCIFCFLLNLPWILWSCSTHQDFKICKLSRRIPWFSRTVHRSYLDESEWWSDSLVYSG